MGVPAPPLSFFFPPWLSFWCMLPPVWNFPRMLPLASQFSNAYLFSGWNVSLNGLGGTLSLVCSFNNRLQAFTRTPAALIIGAQHHLFPITKSGAQLFRDEQQRGGCRTYSRRVLKISTYRVIRRKGSRPCAATTGGNNVRIDRAGEGATDVIQFVRTEAVSTRDFASPICFFSSF